MLYPWYHTGIDFVGPVSPTLTNGSRYILTISDYFTKFVEAFALESKHAMKVWQPLFLMYHIIAAHVYRYPVFNDQCQFDVHYYELNFVI